MQSDEAIQKHDWSLINTSANCFDWIESSNSCSVWLCNFSAPQLTSFIDENGNRSCSPFQWKKLQQKFSYYRFPIKLKNWWRFHYPFLIAVTNWLLCFMSCHHYALFASATLFSLELIWQSMVWSCKSLAQCMTCSFFMTVELYACCMGGFDRNPLSKAR